MQKADILAHAYVRSCGFIDQATGWGADHFLGSIIQVLSQGTK
jgi:hypothetical protein